MWQKILLTWALGIVTEFAKGLAQFVWDSFWDMVDEAVREAEKKWVESGEGTVREDFVVEAAMKFFEEKKIKLSFIKRKALERVLRSVVTQLIDDVNDKVGHDWVKKVDNLKKYLADKIPVIK